MYMWDTTKIIHDLFLWLNLGVPEPTICNDLRKSFQPSLDLRALISSQQMPICINRKWGPLSGWLSWSQWPFWGGHNCLLWDVTMSQLPTLGCHNVTMAFIRWSQWPISQCHNKLALPFYTKAGEAVWYSGPGKHHCQARKGSALYKR